MDSRFWSTDNGLSPDTLGALMEARQTVRPRRLTGPVPSLTELQHWLASAASAPDHGRNRPWRFVLVPESLRSALGTSFTTALLERDPTANAEQQERAHDKALRAPVLMLVVVDAQCGDQAIDVQQRIFSAGCAVQNLLLMATAMGYGSSLTSGKAMHSAPLRGLFHLGEHEHALCFVNLGTITSAKPPPARPTLDDYVRTLTADGQVVGIHPDIQTAP